MKRFSTNRDSLYLGTIPPKKKVKIDFTGVDLALVDGAKSSCGCSTPKLDKESGKVSVYYIPNDIPYHLRGAGEYVSTQKIFLFREGEAVSTLKFRATIKR